MKRHIKNLFLGVIPKIPFIFGCETTSVVSKHYSRYFIYFLFFPSEKVKGKIQFFLSSSALRMGSLTVLSAVLLLLSEVNSGKLRDSL